MQEYGERASPQQCHSQLALQVAWEDPVSHLAAPRVLQPLSPVPATPWAVLAHLGLELLPAFLHSLPHLTQHFSPSQSSWSQHHIQHSLTTEPPSCLLSHRFWSVQGRNSRLLPTSCQGCPFPNCTKEAPKEWDQEFCVQRWSRMAGPAAPFLHLKALQSSPREAFSCSHGTTTREGQGTPLGLGRIFQLRTFHGTCTCGIYTKHFPELKGEIHSPLCC